MNSTSSQAEVFLLTWKRNQLTPLPNMNITVMLAQRNFFFLFFVCLCVSARLPVDLLNSLPCFYGRFHQNDNSSNNKKDPRWRCRWKEGREGELKYEMHLALAQYNGPAFSPLPPSSCQTAVLSSSSSGNLDCFT